MQDAESQNHQTKHVDHHSGRFNRITAKYVFPFHDSQHTDKLDRSNAPAAPVSAGESFPDAQPVDEATMIEERRKKREAIKAKHRGQATPLLVQALALNSASTPTTSKLQIAGEEAQILGKLSSTDSKLPTK